jgi:hypothetical protein
MEVRLSGLGFEQGLLSSMKHPQQCLTALAVTCATTNGFFLDSVIPLFSSSEDSLEWELAGQTGLIGADRIGNSAAPAWLGAPEQRRGFSAFVSR